MTQTVGTFAPLQQTNAYGEPPAMARARMAVRNPSFAGGYEGAKFYNNNPWYGSFGGRPQYPSGYQGYKFYNPSDDVGYNPIEETVVQTKTVSVKHPASRAHRRVTVKAMRPVGDGLAEVDVGEGYAMLWDTETQKPHVTSVQSCPPGYRLYAGRCFRRVSRRVSRPASGPPPGTITAAGTADTPPTKPCAKGTEWAWHPVWGVWYCRNVTVSAAPEAPPATVRAQAAVRQGNPMHPVYLNPMSLPWAYPWSYTQNPRTLGWGYNHPRYGYQTPWSGYGGYYPGYTGRSYYDERVVCERVDEDETCPVGTVVERDRDGNKMCCEQDGPNPWTRPQGIWPFTNTYWWCPGPGCGYYPRRHHGHHRRHGARAGDRGTVRGTGGLGMSGGARAGGGQTGAGGLGMPGGATGRPNPGYEENPCCNVQVPTGPVDLSGNRLEEGGYEMNPGPRPSGTRPQVGPRMSVRAVNPAAQNPFTMPSRTLPPLRNVGYEEARAENPCPTGYSEQCYPSDANCLSMTCQKTPSPGGSGILDVTYACPDPPCCADPPCYLIPSAKPTPGPRPVAQPAPRPSAMPRPSAVRRPSTVPRPSGHVPRAMAVMNPMGMAAPVAPQKPGPQGMPLPGVPVPQGVPLPGVPAPQGAPLPGVPVPQGAPLPGVPVPGPQKPAQPWNLRREPPPPTHSEEPTCPDGYVWDPVLGECKPGKPAEPPGPGKPWPGSGKGPTTVSAPRPTAPGQHDPRALAAMRGSVTFPTTARR